MAARRKYSGYTLVEMLVVMAILVIIGTLGFTAFSGLRASVSLNEQIQTFSQDVRYSQRSALFLERGTTERWVYGIGIDFSDIEQDYMYKTFRWCSPYDSFGATRTRGTVPNYDKSVAISNLNANLPISQYIYKDCTVGFPLNELVATANINEGKFDANFNLSIPSDNNAVGDVGGVPVFVVFESVSGRAFFYDENGLLVNYNASGSIVENPIDFKLVIESPNTNIRKILNIHNISGKVEIETQDM